MDTISCIKTRRSRRNFENKEVPEVLIEKILECAICAPSSMDSQPWHFIIVKDQILKNELAKLKEKDGHKHILTAPVVIVVCVNTDMSPSHFIEDGVTATENILLAAHDLGLGSVYLSAFHPSKPEMTDKIGKTLSIPENIIPITILPIGYYDPTEELDDKKKLILSSIVHHNSYGK